MPRPRSSTFYLPLAPADAPLSLKAKLSVLPPQAANALLAPRAKCLAAALSGCAADSCPSPTEETECARLERVLGCSSGSSTPRVPKTRDVGSQIFSTPSAPADAPIAPTPPIHHQEQVANPAMMDVDPEPLVTSASPSAHVNASQDSCASSSPSSGEDRVRFEPSPQLHQQQASLLPSTATTTAAGPSATCTPVGWKAILATRPRVSSPLACRDSTTSSSTASSSVQTALTPEEARACLKPQWRLARPPPPPAQLLAQSHPHLQIPLPSSPPESAFPDGAPPAQQRQRYRTGCCLQKKTLKKTLGTSSWQRAETLRIARLQERGGQEFTVRYDPCEWVQDPDWVDQMEMEHLSGTFWEMDEDEEEEYDDDQDEEELQHPNCGEADVVLFDQDQDQEMLPPIHVHHLPPPLPLCSSRPIRRDDEEEEDEPIFRYSPLDIIVQPPEEYSPIEYSEPSSSSSSESVSPVEEQRQDDQDQVFLYHPHPQSTDPFSPTTCDSFYAASGSQDSLYPPSEEDSLSIPPSSSGSSAGCSSSSYTEEELELEFDLEEPTLVVLPRQEQEEEHEHEEAGLVQRACQVQFSHARMLSIQDVNVIPPSPTAASHFSSFSTTPNPFSSFSVGSPTGSAFDTSETRSNSSSGSVTPKPATIPLPAEEEDVHHAHEPTKLHAPEPVKLLHPQPMTTWTNPFSTIRTAVTSLVTLARSRSPSPIPWIMGRVSTPKPEPEEGDAVQGSGPRRTMSTSSLLSEEGSESGSSHGSAESASAHSRSPSPELNVVDMREVQWYDTRHYPAMPGSWEGW